MYGHGDTFVYRSDQGKKQPIRSDRMVRKLDADLSGDLPADDRLERLEAIVRQLEDAITQLRSVSTVLSERVTVETERTVPARNLYQGFPLPGEVRFIQDDI